MCFVSLWLTEKEFFFYFSLKKIILSIIQFRTQKNLIWIEIELNSANNNDNKNKQDIVTIKSRIGKQKAT